MSGVPIMATAATAPAIIKIRGGAAAGKVTTIGRPTSSIFTVADRLIFCPLYETKMLCPPVSTFEKDARPLLSVVALCEPSRVTCAPLTGAPVLSLTLTINGTTVADRLSVGVSVSEDVSGSDFLSEFEVGVLLDDDVDDDFVVDPGFVLDDGFVVDPPPPPESGGGVGDDGSSGASGGGEDSGAVIRTVARTLL